MTPKAAAIVEKALADSKLSDGALRLLLILAVLNEENTAAKFALSYRQCGQLVGLTDKATIYARLKNLSPKDLRRLGVRGCPPTMWFELKL